MIIDSNDLLNSIISSFDKARYIKSEEIPGIDLYMDQVTTFLDEGLKSSTRNISEDEKLITKTMINNYAKNDVIPPPVRKKYSKDHMLLLIFLYYYKNILQINDVKDLMDPITRDFFHSDSDFGMKEVYDEIFGSMKDELAEIKEDVINKLKLSEYSYENAPLESREYLKLFSFISSLGADVYIKKLIIEKIIDSLRENRKTEEEKKTK